MAFDLLGCLILSWKDGLEEIRYVVIQITTIWVMSTMSIDESCARQDLD